MTPASYFVRTRGKVTGPYDVATLQKLVRRGSLSRAHEVSQDRQTWSGAGEFTELFAESDRAPSGANTSFAAPAASGATATMAAQPVPPHKSGQFYYSQGGSTVGPLSMNILRSLAGNGTLRAEDLVWREGAEAALPASRVPDLVAAFTGTGGNTYQARGTPEITAKESANAKRALGAAHGRSLVIGIISGVLLILFLNLPFGSVEGRVIWWWDILQVPDTGAVRVFCFYVLLAGITLCILSPMISGVSRAITFISVTLLGAILMLVAGLSVQANSDGFVIGLLIPLITASLLATSLFRLQAPRVTYGLVWHGVLGGCLVIATLIVAIVAIIQLDHGELRTLFHRRAVPFWFILTMTLIFIGHMTGMVAGICALVSLKSTSRGLLRATHACGLISFCAPAPAAIILAAGMLDSSGAPQMGIWMFFVVRLVFIVYAILTLLLVGFGEMLTTLHFQPLQSPSSSRA